MKPATLTKSYYPALDGLRGLAILAVLFHHNFDFLPLPRFGWTGVDLFFVLSGFLITDILLRAKGEKNFLSNFFIRRILRIFPLYYGTIILFFILAPLSPPFKNQYDYYHANQSMLWWHLQNYLCITKPEPESHSVFLHFWSLSVEEQFYLFWPLIILFCKRIKTLIIFVFAILVACMIFRLSTWLYFGNGNTNFRLQYMTRMDGLCIGSLIALWRTVSVQSATNKMLRLGILMLTLQAAAFLFAKLAYPNFPNFSIFGYSTISVCFGSLLIVVIEKGSRITKFIFENRVLKELGRISYGVYVYHWPLLVIFRIYVFKYAAHSGLSNYKGNLMVSGSAAILAIIVSAISYHLFEKRILALKDVVTADGFLKHLRQRIFPYYKPKQIKGVIE